MSTGDRVIFKLANQRVDKKDLEDISVLNQEVLSRTVGALIGDTSGVLTNIPYEWDPVYQILSLGTFVLAWGSPFRKENGETVYSPENYLEGGVLIHDPTRPGQAGWSELDLSGAPARCHLWFRREEVETDDDNRAYWPADSEQVTVTQTRRREIAIFSYSETAVDPLLTPSNGWFRFAIFYKTGPGDAASTLVPLSAFGDNKPVEDTELLNAYNSDLMGMLAVGTAPSRQRPWGIGRLAQELINSILRMRDSQVSIDANNRALLANPNLTDWRATPSRGIFQLDRDLTQLTSDVSSLWDSTTATRPGVLATIVHDRVYNTEGGNTIAKTGFYNGLINVTHTGYQNWGSSTPVTNENDAYWWLIVLEPATIQWPFEPANSVVSPPTYDSAVITSVIVQPHHPAEWTLPDNEFPGGEQDEDLVSAAAIAELQQWKPFPVTLTPGATQKLKLRWRSVNGNKQRPDRGWTMTIMGYLVQSANI